MKLIFPNGEHGQVDIDQDTTVTVGSGDGADVRLSVDGIGAVHARIQYTPEGAFISVDNAANITRVNGSLVVARTPLKGGDALLFGAVQCQVAGDLPEPARGSRGTGEIEMAAEEPAATAVRRAVPQFMLRGVSGSTFGKHFPLYGSTLIGRHTECDICLPSDEVSRKHARVTIAAEGLFVEDLESANGTYVNGRRVRKEKIEPGDELKLDTVRFLVQSAGGNEAPRASRETTPPPSAPPRPESSGSGKWIAVAVLVMVAAGVGLKLAGVI